MEKWIKAVKNEKEHHIQVLDSSNSLVFRPDEDSHPFDMAYHVIYEGRMLHAIATMQMKCPYYSTEYCRAFLAPTIRQLTMEHVYTLYHKVKQQDLANISALLKARDKKELDKLEKSLLLDMEEFHAFLCLADEMGYRLTRKYHNDTKPEHIPTKEELAALKSMNEVIPDDAVLAKKAAKKIIAIKNYRKLRASFLIEKDSEWHIFSYDLVDELYAPPERNHFKHEHMHYSSHLFGSAVDKKEVWNNLCSTGKFNAPCIHVRVKDASRENPQKDGPSNQVMWFE